MYMVGINQDSEFKELQRRYEMFPTWVMGFIFLVLHLASKSGLMC